MIYLRLFLTFLEIGAFSFGGGYGMISIISQKVINNGWMTEEELLNMIAISESTPGPLAVNMATFIGSNEAGFLGALVSTIGVILPAFLIILCIASLIKNLLKYKGVKAFLNGIRPAIIGLILATSLTMLLSQMFNIKNINSNFSFDYKALIILCVLILISFLYKKVFKREISPILLILISAVGGILIYLI